MEYTHPHHVTDDHGKELVFVDASFAPLIPKFLSNRKKEVTVMQDALAAKDFETA